MININFSKWPDYDNTQIEKVQEILSSGKVNYWTGNETKTFELEFAKYIGSKKAVALANGSLALTAAYKSIGIRPGDRVITTPRTFIATSLTALELGAEIAFADVDPDSGAINAETIEPLINKNTKAISVVHLGGWPAEMDNIMKLSNSYKIPVIEDCSQAHGAKLNGKSVGTFGDVSTWSFCQDKIISTGGEGGMITTSNLDIWSSIYSYKDHGKNFKKLADNNDFKSFRWVHDSLGTNMRLTEMQSAIGRIQLDKLVQWNKKRASNAKFFINSLKDLFFLRVPTPPSNIIHGWYRFYVFVKPEYLLSDWSRDRIIFEITKLGVPIFSGSCSEIYLEKCFKNKYILSNNSKRLKVARNLGETSLCLLVHPTLKLEELNDQVEIIKKVLLMASKK